MNMDSNYCWLKLVFLDFFLCHCCCVIVPASVWPEGYYGLPMANTGCPGGASVNWETGWIFQDTENDNPSSSKSQSFHLEGQVKQSSVNRSFCTKTNGTNDQQRPLWPTGTYCIYQGSSKCPLGFKSGSITWDDEDDQNKNDKNGTLPEVLLGSTTTKIYFCCRNDGRKSIPIDLPTASPFYLFAHKGSLCQQVRWAVSTSEWILYDTEDDGYKDDVSQPAPYVTDHTYGPKIYYCYYTSCQYTLNASTGSIEFPLSTRNYANGQQCFWRISVKSYQTIQVRFKQVLFSDFNDQLIFYDGIDDSAPRLAILYGKISSWDSSAVPDVYSSSSNLFVVFRSNKADSSDGFKATYKAIGTSTAPPLTSSPSSTTTVKTTSTTSTTTTTTTSAAATPTMPFKTDTVQKTDRPTSLGSRATLTTETTETDTVQKTDRPTSLGSRAALTTETTEPSDSKGNFSKNYDTKSCVQQSQPGLTTVAIVIPLICIIAVIVMAAYLFFRLRKLPKQPSDLSVRFTPESVTNPSYTQSDAVIEVRAPSTKHTYEDSKGDVYDEVEYQAQTTDNPLYQSTNSDNHVYASFA